VRGGIGGETCAAFPCPSLSTCFLKSSWLSGGVSCLRYAGWQEAERAYLLWKARQVADAASSYAATPVMEAVPKELRRRKPAGGGRGLPGVSIVAAGGGEERKTRAVLLEHAVKSLKPGVLEELMEMMG
jgi:hypothetical protein